mgnify:CR=1 FL=1
MSGHSKWNNIKRKKEATDAAKGKIFTKIGREITVCVKEGGPDPNSNSKLRDLIAKAKSNNVPNDNIERVIKKAAGGGDKNNYETMIYEGYGPNGVAVIVECLTDNKNRTAADVRHIFDKFGGNLGTSGCVSYMFDKKGLIVVSKESTKMSEDEIMLLSIDAGAEDFSAEDEYYEITTSPEDFSKTREELEKNGIEFEQAEITMIPSTYVSLDEEKARKMQLLIDNLEDLDDVLEVYHNWEE